MAFIDSLIKNTNLITYRFFRLNIKGVMAINTKLTEAYLSKGSVPGKRARVEDEDVFLIDPSIVAVLIEDKSYKKGTKCISKQMIISPLIRLMNETTKFIDK